MVAIGLVILVGVTCYLVALGTLALIRPDAAYRFLAAFAQTASANRLEAILRSLAGAGAVLASGALPHPRWWAVGGVFLIVTAIAMLALPDLHRRFAARAVPKARPFMRPIGIVAVAASMVLGRIIGEPLESALRFPILT
jgi:multisubunit Na+/H+ antiporter MnhG subunit